MGFKEITSKIDRITQENHTLQSRVDEYTLRIRRYEDSCNHQRRYETEYHELHAKLQELEARLRAMRSQPQQSRQDNELIVETENIEKVKEEDLTRLHQYIEILMRENTDLERVLREKETRTNESVTGHATT